MKRPEKICLSCKHFHLVDERAGKCRLDKGKIDKNDYPVRQHQETCRQWLDGGQQFYIRIGWIKSRKEKAQP
ncbi:MAG: hypothetical protein LJE64_02580 [Desulfofustis sp.]|nr:hypothetical protein [Desulfofustis sp.]